jgi:DNA-binding response OmpR family regulator
MSPIPIHILVIDDEEQILEIVKQILLRFDYRVEVASDGWEGINKFDNGCFDLVITDLAMPKIDGNDVLRHIRASNKPNTPVIGFSGTPWLLESGTYDSIFPKPFPVKELVNTVRDLTSPPSRAVAH